MVSTRAAKKTFPSFPYKSLRITQLHKNPTFLTPVVCVCFLLLCGYNCYNSIQPGIGNIHFQQLLGGGFKDFLTFIPIPGEMIQFQEHIFQMGGSTTNWIKWAPAYVWKLETNLFRCAEDASTLEIIIWVFMSPACQGWRSDNLCRKSYVFNV